MSSAIEKLRACKDADELNTALRLLCTSFGAVSSLRIVEVGKPGQRQMLCFLRFENIDARTRFSAEFSVGSFGGELILSIDLHAENENAESITSKLFASSTTWKLPRNHNSTTK